MPSASNPRPPYGDWLRAALIDAALLWLFAGLWVVLFVASLLDRSDPEASDYPLGGR